MKSKCNKLVKQSKKKYLKDASFKGTATASSLIIKVSNQMEIYLSKYIQVKDLHEKVDIRTNDLMIKKALAEFFNKYHKYQ